MGVSKFAALAGALATAASGAAMGQTTTNTNCMVVGSQVYCNGTTTQAPVPAATQIQQNYPNVGALLSQMQTLRQQQAQQQMLEAQAAEARAQASALEAQTDLARQEALMAKRRALTKAVITCNTAYPGEAQQPLYQACMTGAGFASGLASGE